MSYISLPNNRHHRQKLFFLKLEIVLFLQLCCLFSPIYFLLRYFCIIHFSFQIDMQCKLKQNLFLERHLSLSVRVCQLNHDVKFPVAEYGFWHPSRPSHWSLDWGEEVCAKVPSSYLWFKLLELYTSFLSDNDFVNKFRTTIRSVSDKYADYACVNPALKWKMIKYISISATFTKEICIFGRK